MQHSYYGALVRHALLDIVKPLQEVDNAAPVATVRVCCPYCTGML
jgi:hypothetical protein